MCKMFVHNLSIELKHNSVKNDNLLYSIDVIRNVEYF